MGANNYGKKPRSEVYLLTRESPQARLTEKAQVKGLVAYRPEADRSMGVVRLMVGKAAFAVPPFPLSLRVKFADEVIPDGVGMVHATTDDPAVVLTVAYENVEDMG